MIQCKRKGLDFMGSMVLQTQYCESYRTLTLTVWINNFVLKTLLADILLLRFAFCGCGLHRINKLSETFIHIFEKSWMRNIDRLKNEIMFQLAQHKHYIAMFSVYFFCPKVKTVVINNTILKNT